ncbi:MAG: hypothetical protein E6Q87_05920 [Cellvibrionales bacterium]|jgi:hypothetical protein|nr:hypothetical protein [Cellvibrionales bacterium]MBK8674942.1 hypothetical protein [Cellvibrionales bacterium]TXH48558.1 MAG: hypothetical protein E6Q87_05920 [Cellvibrionales bacterium]HRF87631.1 hypothetical protein [Pseudomonadales bacterium]HRG49446.1 hypothetical protein [Pseudomonadales bacterium]
MTDFQKIVKPTLLLKGKACFAQIHDATIIVSDIPKWTNELVLEYLNGMTKVGGGVSVPASVAVFLGDSFDAGQRKLSAEWIAENGFEPAKRITMISDSLLIRGSLTAYSWLTKTEAKAFAMKDHKAMCDWITRGQIATAAQVHDALSTSFHLLGKKLP